MFALEDNTCNLEGHQYALIEQSIIPTQKLGVLLYSTINCEKLQFSHIVAVGDSYIMSALLECYK